MEGKPFYLPTQELAFVKNVHEGSFDVLQLPTVISGHRRWQMFNHNEVTNRVDCFNIEVSADGLFNIAGTQLYTSPSSEYTDSVLERSPGKCPFTNRDLVPIKSEANHAETCLKLSPSGYVQANCSSSWDASHFTVELYVRADKLNQAEGTGLFSCSIGSGSRSFQIDLDSSGKYRYHHQRSDARFTFSQLTTEWQHIAVTYDGLAFKGVVNGSIATKLELAATPVRFENYVIGANRARDKTFTGCIDEVRIWSRSRTASEIKSSMHKRLVGDEPGLKTYFRLDEGQGKTVYDQCDSAISGVLHGSGSWIWSDAPIGDSHSMRRSSFSLQARRLKGLCAELYYQQEKVSTGYDGSIKPMKKHARLMLAMGTTDMSHSDSALATLDIAVSRQGCLAQIPDVVSLTELSEPVTSTNVSAITDLEGQIRSLEIQNQQLMKALKRGKHLANDVYDVEDGNVMIEKKEWERKQLFAELESSNNANSWCRLGLGDGYLHAQPKNSGTPEDGQIEFVVDSSDRFDLFRFSDHTGWKSIEILTPDDEVCYIGLRDNRLTKTNTPLYWVIDNSNNFTFSGSTTKIHLPPVHWYDADSRHAVGAYRDDEFTMPVAEMTVYRRRITQKDADDRSHALDLMIEAVQDEMEQIERIPLLEAFVAEMQEMIDAKNEEIISLSGELSTQNEVPMSFVYLDPSGLTTFGGLLKFAKSHSSPHVLGSAVGQLGVYFRCAEPDGDLMVAYYDTTVSQSRFLICNDLTFTSSVVGRAPQDSVEISGSSNDTCTLTVTENSLRITETWTGLPREARKLAEIINGAVTRPTEVTVTITPPLYDVSKRSCLVLAVVPEQVSKNPLTNVTATVMQPLGTRWISDAQGGTYFFDHDVQAMKLPNSKLSQTVPETGLTVEAWINVDERKQGRACIVHHYSNDFAYHLSLVPAAENKYKLFAGISLWKAAQHAGLKVVQSKDLIMPGRWTHVGMRFKQSYALQFDGAEHVDCGKNAQLDIKTDMTIEVSLLLDDLSKSHGILGKGFMGEEDAGVPYQLQVNSDGKIVFSVENDKGEKTSFTSTGSLIAGNFYHVAITRKRGTKKNSSVKSSVVNFEVDGERKSMNIDTISSVDLDEFSEIKFFIDGTLSGTSNHNEKAPLGNDRNLEIGRCQTSSHTLMYTRGKISEVRLWKRALPEKDIGSKLKGRESGLVAWWEMEDHEGNIATDSKGSNDGHINGAVWVRNPNPDSRSLSLLIDGSTRPVEIPSDSSGLGIPILGRFGWGSIGFSIGSVTSRKPLCKFLGMLEEIRVWRSKRTDEQIMDNLFTRLKGEKKDLMAYYTFDEISCRDEALFLMDNGFRANDIPLSSTAASRPRINLSTAPIGTEMVGIRPALFGIRTPMQMMGRCLSVGEYADMQRNEEGNLEGVLKRCYSLLKDGRWMLITGFKVGNLTTEWIGQAQFDPQIMGYIEGAPPIPSENLVKGLVETVADASAVEMEASDSVTYSIGATKEGSYDVGFSASANLVGGSDDLLLTAPFGFGVAKKVTDIDIDVGAKGNFNVTEGWSQGETAGKGVNRVRTTYMGTGGDFESPVKAHQRNPETGCRALPVNMGIALVQSSTADIFALRLKHNNALVSYRMLPNPDIPKDWNMISFPINKFYTKQGTLDGRLGYDENGAIVLDESYENCAGYGEYSYFKPKEAYAVERLESW